MKLEFICGLATVGSDWLTYCPNVADETNAVYTWDFSLTEGESAIVPHWRFERLLQRRREERAAGRTRVGSVSP
jgi:hypothetical protein